jgi:hypothetical protein
MARYGPVIAITSSIEHSASNNIQSVIVGEVCCQYGGHRLSAG